MFDGKKLNLLNNKLDRINDKVDYINSFISRSYFRTHPKELKAVKSRKALVKELPSSWRITNQNVNSVRVSDGHSYILISKRRGVQQHISDGSLVYTYPKVLNIMLNWYDTHMLKGSDN